MLARICQKCGAPADQRRCSGCKAVFYCSRLCQVADFRTHKKLCVQLHREQSTPSPPTLAMDDLVVTNNDAGAAAPSSSFTTSQDYSNSPPSDALLLPENPGTWSRHWAAATDERVGGLPLAKDHVWICTVLYPPKSALRYRHGVLSIMDNTTKLKGLTSDGLLMGIGQCPSPNDEEHEVVRAILATMIGLSPKNPETSPTEREFYAPRRPGFILLGEDLGPCLVHVQNRLAALGITVAFQPNECLQAVRQRHRARLRRSGRG